MMASLWKYRLEPLDYLLANPSNGSIMFTYGCFDHISNVKWIYFWSDHFKRPLQWSKPCTTKHRWVLPIVNMLFSPLFYSLPDYTIILWKFYGYGNVLSIEPGKLLSFQGQIEPMDFLMVSQSWSQSQSQSTEWFCAWHKHDLCPIIENSWNVKYLWCLAFAILINDTKHILVSVSYL